MNSIRLLSLVLYTTGVLPAQNTEQEAFKMPTYVSEVPRFEIQFSGLITKPLSNTFYKNSFINKGTLKVVPQWRLGQNWIIGIPLHYNRSLLDNNRLDITKLSKDSLADFPSDGRLKLFQNTLSYGLRFGYAHLVSDNFVLQYTIDGTYNSIFYSGVPYTSIPSSSYNFSSLGLGFDVAGTYYFDDSIGVGFLINYHRLFNTPLNPADMGFSKAIFFYQDADLKGQQSVFSFGIKFNLLLKH